MIVVAMGLDWLSDALQTILDFFAGVPLWILDLIKALITKLYDLFVWYRTETFNTVFNFIWDNFSKLSGIENWSWSGYDPTLLSTAYMNVNLFFPLDDLIGIAIVLFETWMAVKIFRTSTLLYAYLFRPKKTPFTTTTPPTP